MWSTVRLKVESTDEPAIISNNSTESARPGEGGEAGAVGTLEAGTLWLGKAGAPLPGCVHALHEDDRELGLWAFTHQPEAAHCVACTHR